MSEQKENKWYKAELYGDPLITYLVVAGSYEAVKKSFGCLLERYKISSLDYEGMKEFFADKVFITAVKTSSGGGDITFIKDEEICVLRIVL